MSVVKALLAPRSVVVHPLLGQDAGYAVDTVFATLSPRSRFLRFHSAMPRLPAAIRDSLIDLDGRNHAAVVAEISSPDGPVPVGIARIAAGGSDWADLAIAVADDWQRRGVGRRLLKAVAALATDLGYAELRGAVLPENVAMLRLVRSVVTVAEVDCRPRRATARRPARTGGVDGDRRGRVGRSDRPLSSRSRRPTSGPAASHHCLRTERRPAGISHRTRRASSSCLSVTPLAESSDPHRGCPCHGSSRSG